MENLTTDRFEIVMEEGEPLRIVWQGHCQLRKPSATIDPYLERVLGDLRKKRIVVDFRGLTFMNSSAVYSVINMCKLLEKNENPTSVVYSNTQEWQRVTFSGLERLSKVLKYITVESQ